jgi:ssDNA-binding Zn-finger/Zn-ribbon topoisomerase 1
MGYMHIIHPKKNDSWKEFWGCDNYPECEGSRNIKKDGTVETDYEAVGRIEDARSWAEASFDEIHYRD